MITIKLDQYKLSSDDARYFEEHYSSYDITQISKKELVEALHDFEEDRLLNEHGGEYSGLEEDGIDSNEYYRIITERVINTLKKNNNYMQEEPVSEGKDIFDNCLKSEEKFILPQKISGNINCENCLYSSACALGDIQACIIDKPVSEELEEVANKYAIESYPDEPSTGQFGTGEYESYVNMSGQRECAVEDFKAGAKWQAEKDLELSWEDIKIILDIENDILCECNSKKELVIETYPKGKDYYGEILKRFKERKEK